MFSFADLVTVPCFPFRLSMDSESTLPDEGTGLPLPQDIDSHVGSIEPAQGDVSPTREPETGLSCESEQLDDSLWDTTQQPGDFDHLEEMHDIDFPDAEGQTDMGHNGDTLTDVERATLDSMVHQAMLSTSLTDGLSLPWESGVMATIFGDAPLVAVPQLPKVAHTLDHSEMPPDSPQGQMGSRVKKAKTDAPTSRLYERAISFKNTFSIWSWIRQSGTEHWKSCMQSWSLDPKANLMA